MRSSLRAILYPSAAVMLGLVAAGRAEATPMQLTITVLDENTGVYSTNIYTDAGTPNSISVAAGMAGQVSFTGEFSQSVIAGTTDALTSSATTITNTSATDTYEIFAAVSGANFTGPDNMVSASGSGTWLDTVGSTITLDYYDDPANVLGAQCTIALPQCQPLTTPGNLVFSFTSAPATATSSYAFNPATTMLATPDGALYSMTEYWTYTLLPGGELTSRGQTETKTFTPEPASLTVIGIGLLGIGLVRRRRKAA